MMPPYSWTANRSNFIIQCATKLCHKAAEVGRYPKTIDTLPPTNDKARGNREVLSMYVILI